MLKRISNKMILYFTILIIILISITLSFINGIVRETHLNLLKQDMVEKIRFIEHFINKSKSKTGIREQANKISKMINLRITLIDFDGNVIADSEISDPEKMDNHLYRNEVIESNQAGYGKAIRYSNTLKIDMLYIAKKTPSFYLRLAKPLYEIEENLSRIKTMMLTSGSFVIFFAIVLIIIISRRMTKPIHESLEFAEEFAKGRFSRRILNYSDDEIGNLQKSLNRLADIIVDKINSLINEQNKLKITIESIQDGIAVVDKNKKVILCNRGFIKLLDIQGFSPDKNYYEMVRNRSLNTRIEDSLIKIKEDNFEEKFLNGRICEIFLHPIAEENTMQGLLIVVHDITDMKRIDRLKTDLVGNLSHELKTPITILKGYLETINQHLNKPEVCREFISSALLNLDRQNSIINDMLTLNMLETTKNFQLEQINLKEIIYSCIEILEPKSLEKKINISFDSNSLDGNVQGNRFLAEAIFFNIIDNAINYNNRGGEIKITSEIKNHHVLINIQDTGIGIPEAAVSRIFERFYRVDKSRSRATGGTGLGLAIVKHSAELLDWKLDVASSPDGTCFTVEI